MNPKLRTKLSQWLPIGLLATRRWLMSQGFSRHALDNLVKSGQLEALCPGVYQRPDTFLRWEGVAASLQRMGADLVVGGLTALELHGHVHYLPLGGQRVVHLYGRSPLPAWMNRLGLAEAFVRHGTGRLFQMEELNSGGDTGALSMQFTRDLPWGDQSRTVKASTPERGFLELLDGVPKQVSFEHADQLMEGLSTLSPHRLQKLLHRTRSVKVKRLFFWLADRHGHAWVKRVEPADFDLGSGKRALVKGGKLVEKYQITVPEEFHG